MMKKLLAIATLSLCALAVAAPSQAQHRGGSGGGRASSGQAGSRAGGSVGAPRAGGSVGGSRVVRPGVGGYGYRGRPYYGSRFGFGFYTGYPYYSPYYYPYGYYGGLYGYPYGYDYPYGGGYYVGGRDEALGYGSVQIKDAPKDAQVFADGYYAGIVDDFDGAFQHLDLEAGPHHIEIREQGQPPVSVDVNVRLGETTTYHAR